MSELKKMLAKHYKEIDDLRRSCKHTPLKMWEDRSQIGRGGAFPSIHIACKNCGVKKIIIRRDDSDMAIKAIKTLELQDGFSDQRITVIRYDYELD